MKSIERRYRTLEEQFPLSSSFVVFARAVHSQGFGKQPITTWFRKLVQKNDYDSKDREKLINWLFVYSNTEKATL